MSNQQLSDELQKPIIRKCEKRKVYSSFKDNIWVADLGDIKLKGKYNKGTRFYYLILIFFVNMDGLILFKKNIKLSLDVSQTKYD